MKRSLFIFSVISLVVVSMNAVAENQDNDPITQSHYQYDLSADEWLTWKPAVAGAR